MALAVWIARSAHGFFALDEPAVLPGGGGAPVLVIEGWLGEDELDQAIAIFRRGRYQRAVTSGGPIESFATFPTYAERAADYLRRHGLAGAALDAVPVPHTAQDRTFASAVWVRDWAAREGVAMGAFDVVSRDAHARRTRLLYRMAFGPEARVGVLSTSPTSYDAQRWWTSSTAFKSLLGEALSLAWTKCCFWPGPPGSHKERWAVGQRRPRDAPHAERRVGAAELPRVAAGRSEGLGSRSELHRAR